MRRRRTLVLPVLLLACAAPAIRAETLYVIEQLVVSVTSAPDSTGERIASIHSGDHVEVIDRQGDEIHVHLANGTEGWVKTSYLSSDPPLKVRLTERTAEVEKLKQDVSRLDAELAATRITPTGKPGGVPADTSPDSASATSASPATPGAESPAADATTHDPSFFMTPPAQPARPIWHWVVGSSVVALGLGFALGWQTLDRRIRRKYGGLRIY
jgi:Bacterial SH3 domain